MFFVFFQLSKVEEQEEATTREVERIYGILKRVTDDGKLILIVKDSFLKCFMTC